MPSKKKKYNARFPAGRIKKIMQTDEEVGKVAQAVPVMISRTLELFVESLMTKSMQITQARCAKTLTPSHMKQCISSESRFDFLKDLVKNIPDPSAQEDNENNAKDGLDYPFGGRNAPEPQSTRANDSNRAELLANYYTEQGPSATVPNNRTPVIQYGPSVAQLEQPTLSFSIENLVKKEARSSPPHRTLSPSGPVPAIKIEYDNVPPLVPISQPVSMYSGQAASGDNNLLIDEDYDN